jgi:hypothetical protein
MTNMPSDEEIIADIERRRAEGTDLDDLLPVKATTPANPRMVFAVRLGYEELKAITEAAQARRLPIGDFIRKAALQAAHDSPESTPDDLEALRTEMRDGFSAVLSRLGRSA